VNVAAAITTTTPSISASARSSSPALPCTNRVDHAPGPARQQHGAGRDHQRDREGHLAAIGTDEGSNPRERPERVRGGRGAGDSGGMTGLEIRVDARPCGASRCHVSRRGGRCRSAGRNRRRGTIGVYPPPDPEPITHPAPASLLAAVELAPATLSSVSTEALQRGPESAQGQNLGVGVYVDETGKVPLLECVKRAEREMVESAMPRSYLPIDGIAAFDARHARCSSRKCDAIQAGRAVTVQALGGTGGLKVGADFLAPLCARRSGLAQRPELGESPRAFRNRRLTVNTYPYYDGATRGLDFDGMVAAARADAGRRHRPAARLLPQPDRRRPDAGAVAAHRRGRPLALPRIPFVDLAYQGFGDGIDATAPSCAASPRTPGPLLVSEARSRSRFHSMASASARCRWSAPTRTKPGAVLSQA